jgi:hypothetical protein
MALTTSSTSPDPKKPDAKPDPDAKPEADKPEAETKSKVTPVYAAGATDPAVQQLVAEQQTAISNGDDDAITEINKKLNELGYK